MIHVTFRDGKTALFEEAETLEDSTGFSYPAEKLLSFRALGMSIHLWEIGGWFPVVAARQITEPLTTEAPCPQ